MWTYFNLCLGYPDSGIQWFQGWTPVPSLSQRFPSSGSWISMRHSKSPHRWMCLSKTSYNVSCQHTYLQSLFELLDIVYVFQDTAIAKANVRRGVSLAWSKYDYDKAWCPYDILRHEGMAMLVYMACLSLLCALLSFPWIRWFPLSAASPSCIDYSTFAQVGNRCASCWLGPTRWPRFGWGWTGWWKWEWCKWRAKQLVRCWLMTAVGSWVLRCSSHRGVLVQSTAINMFNNYDQPGQHLWFTIMTISFVPTWPKNWFPKGPLASSMRMCVCPHKLLICCLDPWVGSAREKVRHFQCTMSPMLHCFNSIWINVLILDWECFMALAPWICINIVLYPAASGICFDRVYRVIGYIKMAPNSPLALSRRASSLLVYLGAPLVLLTGCTQGLFGQGMDVFKCVSEFSPKDLHVWNDYVIVGHYSMCRSYGLKFNCPWSTCWAKSALHRLCGRDYSCEFVPQSFELSSFIANLCNLNCVVSPIVYLLKMVVAWRHNTKDLHNIDLFSGQGAINTAFCGNLTSLVNSQCHFEITMWDFNVL